MLVYDFVPQNPVIVSVGDPQPQDELARKINSLPVLKNDTTSGSVAASTGQNPDVDVVPSLIKDRLMTEQELNSLGYPADWEIWIRYYRLDGTNQVVVKYDVVKQGSPIPERKPNALKK